MQTIICNRDYFKDKNNRGKWEQFKSLFSSVVRKLSDIKELDRLQNDNVKEEEILSNLSVRMQLPEEAGKFF